MMKDEFECKLIYLKLPIFQVVYIILWIPLGFLVSYFLSILTVSLVAKAMIFVLGKIYDIAFDMYMMSGRMSYRIEPHYLYVNIVFDILLLIIGLELINCFLHKKKKKFEELKNNE